MRKWFEQMVPAPMGAYIFLIGGFSLPGLFILHSRLAPIKDTMTTTVIIMNFFIVGVIINHSNKRYMYYQKFFEIHIRNDENTVFSRWGIYIIAIIVSIAGVVVPIKTSLFVIATTNESTLLGTVGLGLGVAFPALYPVIGIFYQKFTQIKTLRNLFKNSRQIDKDQFGIPTDKVKAEIRVYDDSAIGATGVSTGFRDVIFFSDKTAEELDDELFLALLAHEDAHASEYSDGIWAVYAAFVAGITLVGQNILFAALDYPRREIRADKHAAEKTSPAAIKGVIEKMHDKKTTEGVDTDSDSDSSIAIENLPGSSSGRISQQTRNQIHKSFRLFYGGYTLDKAHPMKETRKEEIEKYAEEIQCADRTD